MKRYWESFNVTPLAILARSVPIAIAPTEVPTAAELPITTWVPVAVKLPAERLASDVTLLRVAPVTFNSPSTFTAPTVVNAAPPVRVRFAFPAVLVTSIAPTVTALVMPTETVDPLARLPPLNESAPMVPVVGAVTNVRL